MESTEIQIGAPSETDATARRDSDLANGPKQFLRQLCISVTIFVLLLGLGELGAYLFLRLNQPPLPYTDLPVPAEYVREIQASMRHQYLPFVQYRRKPFHGRFISVDEQGIRRTLYTDCKDAKALQIWMFGDSVLWGTGVADGETVPSQLARLYNDSGRTVCIKNFAEQGWVSTQELVELLLRLKHDRPPDVVVFYDGTDEILLPQPNAPQDIDQGYARVRDILENAAEESRPGFRFLARTNTIRALNLLSKQIHNRFSKSGRNFPPQKIEAAAQSLIANYEKNLGVVDNMSRAYGFQALYFWYPTSSMGKKPLTAEERQSIQRERQRGPIRFQLTQAVYDICSRLQHTNFTYLGNALDDQQTRLYFDTVHLAPEGNRIMAEKIFQALKTNANYSH